MNYIEAISFNKEHKYPYFLEVEYQLIPRKLNDPAIPFEKINILLASDRFF